MLKHAVLWDVTCVALVRTDVSGECIASIARETGISELGTTLAITSNLVVVSTEIPHTDTFQMTFKDETLAVFKARIVLETALRFDKSRMLSGITNRKTHKLRGL
jgi:hypothetical protein